MRPRFADRGGVESPATEVLLSRGAVCDGTVTLAAEVVGLDGRLHRGTLAPGANGIRISAEMLICAAP